MSNHISSHDTEDEACMQPSHVKPNETCYILCTTYDKCIELHAKMHDEDCDVIKTQPMSHSVKLLSGSVDLIDGLREEKMKEVTKLKSSNGDAIATSDNTSRKKKIMLKTICNNRCSNVSNQL